MKLPAAVRVSSASRDGAVPVPVFWVIVPPRSYPQAVVKSHTGFHGRGF